MWHHLHRTRACRGEGCALGQAPCCQGGSCQWLHPSCPCPRPASSCCHCRGAAASCLLQLWWAWHRCLCLLLRCRVAGAQRAEPRHAGCLAPFWSLQASSPFHHLPITCYCMVQASLLEHPACSSMAAASRTRAACKHFSKRPSPVEQLILHYLCIFSKQMVELMRGSLLSSRESMTPCARVGFS